MKVLGNLLLFLSAVERVLRGSDYRAGSRSAALAPVKRRVPLV